MKSKRGSPTLAMLRRLHPAIHALVMVQEVLDNMLKPQGEVFETTESLNRFVERTVPAKYLA